MSFLCGLRAGVGGRRPASGCDGGGGMLVRVGRGGVAGGWHGVCGSAHLLVQPRCLHDRGGEPRRHRRQPELHHRRQTRRTGWRSTAGTSTGPTATTGTIGGANLDGTGVNQNFITGANTPAGVAVDGQHIYWTNNGMPDTIGGANLDGTGVNQSFITGASSPAGVAVDGQHIYWANNGDEHDRGGEPRRHRRRSELHHRRQTAPSGVAVDGQHIYWANVGTAHDRAGEPRRHRRQPELHHRRQRARSGWRSTASTSTGPTRRRTRSGRRTSTAPASTRASSPAPSGKAGTRPCRCPWRKWARPRRRHLQTHRRGSLSAPQTVTLRNTGQRPLSLTGLSFAGADASDFLGHHRHLPGQH